MAPDASAATDCLGQPMQLPPIRQIEGHTAASRVTASIADLEAIDPKWRVQIGVPDDSPLWISGEQLKCAKEGPLHALLSRIETRFRTSDRKTVAASFALRFGWTSSAAIAPFLLHRVVPDVSLQNISLKFREDTLFERSAIHEPRGIVLREHGDAEPDEARRAEDERALLKSLRTVLYEQATPVVDALYDWSGFSKKGSWGQITSSWASQFINVCERFGGQAQAQPIAEAFFAGDDIVAATQPRLHPVTLDDVTHVYQRRATCCRYYLLPQGSLCASCPLVSDEERIRRNLEFMAKQLQKKPSAGHS
jgi:ferric iron reductase protein FhuF